MVLCRALDFLKEKRFQEEKICNSLEIFSDLAYFISF